LGGNSAYFCSILCRNSPFFHQLRTRPNLVRISSLSLFNFLFAHYALNAVRGEPFCVGATSNNDGAAVVLLGCGVDNAGPNFPNGNFTWTAPIAPLAGQVKTFDNKCLDVPNGSTANGVKLQIWTCADGNTNQLFQAHGRQFQWKGTGKCLDLTDGNSTIGNPVRIFFRFVPSSCTEFLLQQIQMWDCAVPDNNMNQDWQLDTVQPS
jgi:hypothetical protein